MSEKKYKIKKFPFSSHTIIAQLIDDMNTDSVIDVGSGDGFLGLGLKHKPAELYAVDFLQCDLPPVYTFFYKEDLNKTDFNFIKNKKFEVIVLADILEHLKNPIEIVHNLKKYLKDDGVFIVSLPNMGFILVRILSFFGVRPKANRGLYDRTHLHDFDLNTIKSFVKDAGLDILKIKSTPVPLPLVSGIFMKNKLFFFIYKIINSITQKIPRIFAYQFVLVLKINKH